MSNYKIKIEYQKDVEADNIDEAIIELEKELATENTTLLQDILDQAEISRYCSFCEQPEDEDGRCGCTNKDSN